MLFCRSITLAKTKICHAPLRMNASDFGNPPTFNTVMRFTFEFLLQILKCTTQTHSLKVYWTEQGSVHRRSVSKENQMGKNRDKNGISKTRVSYQKDYTRRECWNA